MTRGDEHILHKRLYDGRLAPQNLSDMSNRATKELRGLLSPILVVLILCISPIFADQSDILLELAPLSNYTLVGWNADNISRLCDWERVVCDEQNRVIELNLAGKTDGSNAVIVGSLPQSIAGLSSLRSLQLHNNYIYGDFPASIFALPNITSVFLLNTGLTVSFPPNVSRSIRSLMLGHTKIVSPIPELKWDQVDLFDVEATGVSCPLPDGLVSYFEGGGTITECLLYLNKITIDKNNMVCGQIHSSRLTCLVSPPSYKAAFFPTDDTLQAKNFSARLGNFTLEFTEDEVMIFITYSTRAGTRKEYRREYLSFRLMPFTETYGTRVLRLFATMERPFWNNFLNEGNRVRANTTNTNSLVTEYIFDYVVSRDVGYIKVSNIVYNLGHSWIPAPGLLDKVSMFYVFSFRIAHSPAQGNALACFRGFRGGTACSSEVAELESIFDLATGDPILLIRTKTVEFQYIYRLVGSVDGIPLFQNNSAVFAPRLPLPITSTRWIEANRRGGYNVTSNFPPETQSFALPVEISVPEFRNKFLFDPDVSITLLFDPNDAVPPEAFDPGVAVATPVGLIVGLIVGCIAIIAGATFFAAVVYPYMKKRQQDAAAAAVDEEMEDTYGAPQTQSSARWTKSQTPQ